MMIAFAALVLAAQPGAAPAKLTMEQMVGKPIGATITLMGPPARAFDLEEGRRAFQWPSAKTPKAELPPVEIYTTPGALSPPTGAIDPHDPQKVSGQGCYDTLYAEWALDEWLMMEHAGPPADCK